jgi:hypothetical protein
VAKIAPHLAIREASLDLDRYVDVLIKHADRRARRAVIGRGGYFDTGKPCAANLRQFISAKRITQRNREDDENGNSHHGPTSLTWRHSEITSRLLA